MTVPFVSLFLLLFRISSVFASEPDGKFDFRHKIALSEHEFADAYVATVAEVERRGGYISPALEYRRGPYGAAYFATRDIVENEHLIVMPLATTTEYSDIRKRFPDLDSWRGPVQPNGDRSLYALYLATPPADGSGERPYFSWMFPRACANSATFAAKVFRNPRLATPYLTLVYDGLRQRAFTDYDLLRANVPHYMANVTRAQYRLAYCWFETRSFGSRVASEGTASLIPLADLVNHAAQHSMSWSFDDASEKWIFYNIRPIAAGEELFDNYGEAKQAVNLLMTYGFSAMNNMVDNHQLLIESPLFKTSLPLELTRREPHFDELELGPLVAAARRDFNQTMLVLQKTCDSRLERVREFISRCFDAIGANRDPSPQVAASLQGLLSFYRAEFDVIRLGCAALIERITLR